MLESRFAVGSLLIADKTHLRSILHDREERHYTYVLRRPDGVECFGGIGTPFYVGIGQDLRLFSHVEEAKDPGRTGRKVDAIRAIWRSGGEVGHYIDAFHEMEPWDREEELIRVIGQIKHGTGPLTNEQDYAASYKIDGIEVRKYKDVHLNNPDEIPKNFKISDVRLAAGPVEPKSRKSVFGKIYSVLEENPGVTGADLVALLKRVNFSGNKSAYTQSGEVCAAWLCGYIEGGFFRKDRLHLQRYSAKGDRNG